MPYKIVCCIPVEPDDPELYETRGEALRDLENYAIIQPEDIYRVVKVPPGEYRPYSRREKVENKVIE